MKKVRKFFHILKRTCSSFFSDNGFKLSASLSYYTIFAMGPLLLIIISLAGIFFGREAVQGKIYGQVQGLVGSDAAIQIQNIIRNIEQNQHGPTGAVIGAILLFIGASGVFTEMQDSINFIWAVKAKPKKSWLKFLTNRLLSFSLVIGMGFILLVSLIFNAVLQLLSERLMNYFSDYTIYIFYVINLLLILVVIGGLFAVIFKILPDAVIAWKDAAIGAGFTAILFLLGKFLIGYYLGNSNVGTTYGTAASIIIVLLWVYYSSIILYFGAEFTKMYAIEAGSGIKPKETAVFVIKQETKEVPASFLDT